MSVPVEITDDGELVTPWGVVEHTRPEYTLELDERGEIAVHATVGHLCIASGEWIEDLLVGIRDKPDSAFCDAYRRDGRLFLRLNADNGTWTWELFELRWADGLKQSHPLYVGRWPD